MSIPTETVKALVDWAGIWGALTGTAALVIQLFQYFADRPKLMFEASMGISSDVNSGRKFFAGLSLVNHGRRPVKIERAGIILPKGKLLGITSDRSEYVLFDASNKGKLADLFPDGGKITFTEKDFPKDIARQMHQQFKQGKAFVQLTSGKVLTATFLLVNPDDVQ